MVSLPEGVASELARALGAYLRATKPVELPPRLRPFKNFHAKALLGRRDDLLAVLDEDEGLRARIIEWLDEKPTIAKKDADLLRIAAERADGWQAQLASSGKRPARARPAPSGSPPSAEVKKLRERIDKARAETKRVREQADSAVRALKEEVAAARAEVKSEKAAGRAAEKRAEAAEREASKARSDLDRERRKMKADHDRSVKAVADAKRELREVRRELQSRGREIARLEEKLASSTAAKRRPPSARSGGRRKALPVPKGRLEDAPETLEEWLESSDVHLLVDGYNATMAEGGFAHLDLAGQRRRLVDEVGRLARRKGFHATIVFDGSDVVGDLRKSRSPVRVQYSKPGEIADDHLIALLESMPPKPVVLATGDRELQERGRKLGATIATSAQLLRLIR